MGAAGGRDGHAAQAKKAVKIPVTVTAVESYDVALEYLQGTGEFADGRAQHPSLILAMPSVSDPALAEFIRSACLHLKDRPAPLVLLLNDASSDDLETWYSHGANSVVVSQEDELATSIEGIYGYWLVHNRTPKHD